jgi:hypothetical protein
MRSGEFRNIYRPRSNVMMAGKNYDGIGYASIRANPTLKGLYHEQKKS